MLLVHSAQDPTSNFSHYLRELLAVEGFAALEEIELEDLASAIAAEPDGVFLPRMQLPLALADQLVAYVHGGGKLIALHPDSNLVKQLGLVPRYVTRPTASSRFRNRPCWTACRSTRCRSSSRPRSGAPAPPASGDPGHRR